MSKDRHDAGAPRPESLDLIAGKFSVERVLDTQGPCLVVAAKDPASGQQVVVKLLRPELAVDAVVARFLRAARQAATIDSPYVVRVLEADRAGAEGPPYLVMERLKGSSLGHLLALHGPLRLPVALELVLQACAALAAAHAKGVIHGQLRPSKLFRALANDGTASIKVFDFGMAVALTRDTPRGTSVPPGEGIGSPEYRSPEQVAGSRRIEARSDVWGIGLVLYELLTGRHPFAGATTKGALAKAVAAGPPALGGKVAGVSAELEELLRHCLHKDASQRPADVAGVAERLHAALAATAAKPAEPAPARRQTPTPSRDPAGRGRSRRLSTPHGLRPRFMGPALGNRATAGGSYRFTGQGTVTEDVVLPRSRRHPRPDAGEPGASSRRRPAAKPTSQRQAPTGESDVAAIERLLERERQGRIRTDPAVPRAIATERRSSKPPAGAEPVRSRPAPAQRSSGAVSGAPAEGAGPTAWGLSMHEPVEAPGGATAFSPSARRPPVRPVASDDDGPVIEIGGSEADGSEMALGEDERAEIEQLATRTAGSSPDSWELDLPPSPEPPEVQSGPRSGPRRTSMKPVPSTPAPAPGRRAELFGGFVLDRALATTRSSELFLARPASGSSPAPTVVVKRALEAKDVEPSRLQLIARQCRPGAHPNLCSVLAAGDADGTPYLALELVDGIDVRGLLRWAERGGQRIPTPIAAFIVRRAAAALAVLHAGGGPDSGTCGMVHGDIRPSKIYLSVGGEVKLGPPAMRVKADGTPPGKLDFQAPEELAGEAADPQADLFALGVTLGELLVGGPIFAGKGLELLLALHQLDTEPLRRRAPELPARLVAVCEKAMARLPADRFADATSLAEALTEFEGTAGRSPGEQLAELVTQARDGRAAAADADEWIGERSGAETLAAEAVAADARRDAEEDPPLRVRRAHSGLIGQLGLSALLEAVSTGNLGPDDEVTWEQSSFVPIRDVDKLARLLLVSAAAPGGAAAPARGKGLLDRKAPDHVYHTRETPMLEVLSQMRQCSATGLLLVEQLEQEHDRRTEICLRDGRLHSVRSSDASELLGEYLVARGLLDRGQLQEALRGLPAFDGRLGNALVGLGLLDAADAFRAICDQASDRVAGTFAWPEAKVQVYLGYSPAAVPFPVDLDLSYAMIQGVLVATGNDPAASLPGMLAHVEPGTRPAPTTRGDLAAVPPGLRLLAGICGSRPVVAQAMRTLENQGRLDTKQACACIVVARALRWITIRAPGS